MARTFDVEVDQASIRRARAMLGKYEAKPMADRMRKGTLAGARLMVNPVKAVTPVGKTGNLRASITARPARSLGAFGKAITAYVGPTGRKGAAGHLVIRGHRIVGPRPNRVDTGRRAKANPFVDRAIASQLGNALRIVADTIWKG